MANSGTLATAGSSGGAHTSVNPAQQSGSGTVAQQDTPAEEGPSSEISSAPQSPAASPPEGTSSSESEDENDPNSIDQTRWNAIVPEASRIVPVGNVVVRRPGRGRQALSTPITGGIGRPEQAWRVWAMRQLLGEPVGVTDADFAHALIAARWDLGTALRSMNNVLNQAGHRHRANAPNRSPAEQQRDRCLGADSLHHNRRLGVDFLYTRVVQVTPAHQIHMLTTLTVGQLLADHQFDVDEAVNAWTDRLVHPEEVEQHQRMERRLRMINPNQLHQDQRIARLMEIAGTDDYYAARGLLMMHGYDMLRAMDHWMRHGLARQPIPASELNRSLFRTPIRPHLDTEDLWPHPRPIAGRLDEIDEDDLADADADYGHPSYPGRNGWLVRYPWRGARIGVNIPTRNRNDYIRRGEFIVGQYDSVGRLADDTGPRDPFDYNNSEHIERLNNTASQWFRRISGIKSKEKGTPYKPDENEWIWWWHNERLWELIDAHPELIEATSAGDWTRAGFRWPIRTDTQQLSRDFNHHWAPDPTAAGARSTRHARSLDAQRRRILAIVEDFGYPYSPAHKKKKSDDDDKPSEHSVTGSEDEDADNDDDDDAQPPTKKVKR